MYRNQFGSRSAFISVKSISRKFFLELLLLVVVVEFEFDDKCNDKPFSNDNRLLFSVATYSRSLANE